MRNVETKAPLLGEPLALELANATYAVRGHPVDGMQTVPELTAWLHNTRARFSTCLLYTSPSPRDGLLCRMPSSA